MTTKKKEMDFDRDYQNISGGMLVTTIHKGSGAPHVAFVPGQYALPKLDDEGKEIEGEHDFVGHLEGKRYIMKLAKEKLEAQKKESKKRK